VDAAGNLFALQNTQLVVRRPVDSAFMPVAASVDVLSFSQSASHADDGAIWVYNSVVGESGVMRLDATSAAMVIDCNVQELSFCSAEGTFPMGAAGAPVMFVANVFQDDGGVFYRIEDATLVPFATPPAPDRHVTFFTRGFDGKLYIVAAEDNLAGTPQHLYVHEGSGWRQLATLPGYGEVLITADGTIYAGVTNVFGDPGGLWILRR
jgi:hypothetical protein